LKSDQGFNAFIESACAVLDVNVHEVKGRARGHRGLVEARQLIAFVLRERYKLSYPHLGRLLGDRDHTTIMSGVAKVGRALNAREPWAIEGVARVGGAPMVPIELESALDTLQHGSRD
jgi:chromosomal replication initiation ATPase DnaA